MPQASDQQRKNHSRVPIMRSQIRALRAAAEMAYRQYENAQTHDQVGLILTASINAGLALELGFKLFYATYYRRAGRGHNLQKLFGDLPQRIQADIEASYAESLAKSSLPPIRLLAFRFAQRQPVPPQSLIMLNAGEARGLIALASDAFVRARYFFESVNSNDWAVVAYPVYHMLFLSGVLDTVYDEYIRRGRWT